MRSDYALYIVAAFFFILTAISAILIVEVERSLWMVATAVLGLLSVGLGYYQRPKAIVPTQTVSQAVTAVEPVAPEPQAAPVEAPAPAFEAPTLVEEKATEIQTEPVMPEVEAAPAIEAPPEIETPIQPPVMETPPVIEAPAPIVLQEPEAVPEETVSPLTKVKGIGEKRATQLNALGISTVAELAQASPQGIAKSLKISPKIVAKWVDEAKQQK
jgi:predicted flap endonuclease-1-like 5' DNA nuclease